MKGMQEISRLAKIPLPLVFVIFLIGAEIVQQSGIENIPLAQRDVGLLHPDWRKFPHVQLYGWTAHHERQWKYLHNMIVKGALESAYYATETQYKAASLSNQYTVLSRPIVSNVKEVIELLRRNQQFGNYSHSLAESAEYDADDESDEKPGLRCREQKYRRLETAV